MTRRDTIIAAVLVNAGLLIVLFASALKSDSSEREARLSTTDQAEPLNDQSVYKESLASQGDEVDQVLKQYANPTQPVVSALSSAAVQPQEMSFSAGSSPGASFADDLKAITLPEVSSQATLVQTVVPFAVQETVSSAESAVIDYKVKKGDVLEKIARHHHCSVDEIMKLNKLASVNLRIGQTLKIPGKTSSATVAAAKPAPAPATDSSPKYYTVKNGDNPWTIAVKNHMKVEELLKLNNLDQNKARKLKPGDRLRIN